MAKASLPTPSVALINYPSPQIADRLLVERYDHSLSHFGPRNLYTAIPAYGVEHPDTRRFSGFRLAHVKLAVADDWYDWYWVNDRLNQDAYNCEIDYPYGDTAYPRHTRTLLVSRASYAAIAFGTADPANALLLLVAEQTPRIGDETLDSLYVVSKRVYERLPGLPITTWIVDGETQTPAKVVTQKVTKASGNYGTTAPVQSPAAVSATGSIALTSAGAHGNTYTLTTNQGVAVVFEMDTGTAAVASSGGLVTFYANPTAGTVTLTTHAGVAHIFEFVNGAATSGSTQVPLGPTKEMTAMNFASAININGNFTCTMPTTASVSITRVATGADNQTISSTLLQVETATAAGIITGSGNLTVTVTGAALTGSPIALSVAVLNNDTPAQWAEKVKVALNANGVISALYTATRSGNDIILTSSTAPDVTLNIALANGSCTGATNAPTSANTTAGSIAKTNFSGGVTGTTVTSGNTAVTIGGSANASATALAAAINAHAAFAAAAVGPLITITKLGSLYPTITVTGGNANPTNFTGGVEGEASVEYRPINDYYGDLITSSLPNYQTLTRTELSDVQYEYPRIITGIYATALEMDGGQAKATVRVVARSNRKRTKRATTTVTYDASANLTYDAPFDPTLTDLVYDGWFLNIRETNVWVEPFFTQIQFNTASNNPIYGYVGESFYVIGQGTFPTGTKTISCRIRPWKYGLYRKEVTTIEI